MRCFALWMIMGWLALPGCAAPVRLEHYRVIDLTHAFDEDTVYWPTAKTFQLSRDAAGYTDKGYYYAANSFCAAEHGGTHIDAPLHFYEGRDSVDEIPLQRLMGEAVLIDVSSRCASDRDYQIAVGDFLAWERRHHRRLNNVIVLLRTGFGRYYPNRTEYMGTDQRGEQAVALLHFPGLHPDAARWLTSQRQIKAIGLDTPSIDYGQSTHFQSHVTLFEHNVPAFENLANLEGLPEYGFQVIALPAKIRGGSGGPLRIVALIFQKSMSGTGPGG